MRRIEKEIKRDGVDYIAPVSFGDGGMVYYAFAIVVTERAALRMERLIDARVARSYATKMDWWLAMLFLISMDAFVLFSVACYF